MAYYDEDENSQDPNAPQQQGEAGGGIISGQGAASGNSGPSSGPSNTQPDNFVGIKQYIDANKNQSGKLGEQVAQDLGGKVNEAKSNIDALGGQFQGLVNQNKLENLEGAGQDSQRITNTAATGQVGQNLSDQDRARMQAITNAYYQGPKSVEETDIWNPAVQSATKARQSVEQLGNEGGRASYLKDINKNKNYTSGENLFDSILLGGNAQNMQKIQQAGAPASQFQGLLDTISSQGKDYAKGVSDLTDTTREGARSGVGAAQTNRGQQVQDYLNQGKINADQMVQGILSGFDNGARDAALNQQQANVLGLTGGENVYNLRKDSLNPYVHNTFDENRYITKDQQAQLAALNQLAGDYGGDLANSKFTGSEAANLAGTDTLGYGADQSAIRNLLSDLGGSYQSGLNNANSTLAAHQNLPLADAAFSDLGPAGTMPGYAWAEGAANRSPLENMQRLQANRDSRNWAPLYKNNMNSLIDQYNNLMKNNWDTEQNRLRQLKIT